MAGDEISNHAAGFSAILGLINTGFYEALWDLSTHKIMMVNVIIIIISKQIHVLLVRFSDLRLRICNACEAKQF